MTNPLADIANICFFDTETRAEDDAHGTDSNVVTAGTYRYAKKSFVIISTFGIGESPVFDRSLDRGFDGDWLLWEDMPRELHEFYKKAEQREAWFAAWNAGFDRQAWNSGTPDWPRLDPDMVIDVMAQGVASNLPPSLEGASKFIGRGGKHPDGKYLIQLFCTPRGQTPFTKPAEWETFKLYGRQDTEELREVFRHTRPLPFEEWEDYWVSERINDRGVGIDLAMVERAAAVAEADRKRINAQLTRWTNGQITAVTQTARIADWLYETVSETEPRMIITTEFKEDASTEDSEEADLVPSKLSINRDNIEKLLAYYDAKKEKDGFRSERDQTIYDVLEARQYGGSSSPAKFQKMLDQHDGGRLKGQYVFNGAAQTGRFSSKGVQTHNLTRSSLEEFEVPTIEMINELKV